MTNSRTLMMQKTHKKNWKKPAFRFAVFSVLALSGQLAIEACAPSFLQVPLAFGLGAFLITLDDVLKVFLEG